MNEFITPLGREIIKDIVDNYPSLWEFYQIELGNFTFDLDEYEGIVKDDAERWLTNHSDYVLELIEYECECGDSRFYALYDVNDFLED